MGYIIKSKINSPLFNPARKPIANIQNFNSTFICHFAIALKLGGGPALSGKAEITFPVAGS